MKVSGSRGLEMGGALGCRNSSVFIYGTEKESKEDLVA